MESLSGKSLSYGTSKKSSARRKYCIEDINKRMVDFRGKEEGVAFFVWLPFFLKGSKVQLVWQKLGELLYPGNILWALGRAEGCRQGFCCGCPLSERSCGPDRESVCGTQSASFEARLCAVLLSHLLWAFSCLMAVVVVDVGGQRQQVQLCL